MFITKITPVSFSAKKVSHQKDISTLKNELNAKNERIKILEAENEKLKESKRLQTLQELRERETAQRTMCEDLGSLWD